MLEEKTWSSINIAGNQVLILPPLSRSHLLRGLGCICNDSPLIRSGQIDSLEKCHDLLLMVNKLQERLQAGGGKAHKGIRIASMDLNWIDDEWDLIQNQQSALTQMARQNPAFDFAHLSFPTDHALFRRNPDSSSEFMFKTISKLHQQFNNEGWLTYCSWLNKEAEVLLKTFKPEASEEYQLQARLEDLGHEVHSPLLISQRQNISKAILDKLAAAEKGEREHIFKLEKEIVAGREHLKKSLEVQGDLCGNIAEGISKIETMHPGLRPLKIKFILLHQLIVNHLNSGPVFSWGQQLLLTQLLDEYLEVIPTINCNTGIERTNLVFSIRLALIEMKKFYTQEGILELCLNWDTDFKHVAELRKRLRGCVLANLSLMGMRTEGAEISGMWGANPAILGFLPSVADNGAALILKDSHTGNSVDYTEEGRKLLRRLFVL